jgi:uncharacterized protein YceK
MKLLTIVISVVLAGCAAVKTSSPRTVVVTGTLASATPVAQQECAKHNRNARFAGYGLTKLEVIFDCLE